MKHVKTIALAAIMTMSGASLWAQGLKDAYKNYFDVGFAINSVQKHPDLCYTEKKRKGFVCERLLYGWRYSL